MQATKQKKTPPPNYFSRREQYRLLILCATLMLVLFMMNEARKPANWKWMWADGPVPQKNAGPIDTRTDEESANQRNQRMPVDAFQTMRADARESDSNEQDSQNSELAEVELAEVELTEVGSLPGVTKQLLAPIEDNSVLRVAENDAWKTILSVLNTTSQNDIETQSLGDVSFAQLFRQTDYYRGKLVTIRGTVRRAEQIVPRENDHGITDLFRWIVEPAGPSNAPIVVYSLEKPDEFEIGDGLREEATFTAVCFKRWAYAAGDGTRIAPLLLAKTANWQPTPPPEPVKLPTMPAVITTLIGLCTLAAAIAMFAYRSSVSTTPEVERMREPIHSPGEQVNDDDVLPPVSESLRQLAEQRRLAEQEPDA